MFPGRMCRVVKVVRTSAVSLDEERAFIVCIHELYSCEESNMWAYSRQS